MLLLPLGCCALVGFLSWQRLCKPTAAAADQSLFTFRDETRGKLLHFLLVKSGFVHFLLSFVLVPQLARFVEWREINNKGEEVEGSDDGSNLGEIDAKELPQGPVQTVVYGDRNDGRGDVFLCYNPLASIFNAERISDDSDSSISDAKTTVFACDADEIRASDDLYQPQAEASDHINTNSEEDDNANELEFPFNTDLETVYDGPIITSTCNFHNEIDIVRRNGLDAADQSQGDLLTMTDSDGALSCTEEEAMFTEMQLDLESLESMYQACNVEDASWLVESGLDADVNVRESKDVAWREDIGLQDSHSCSSYKDGGRRSKASSISSILTTGSGNVSMMSSTMSSASSASTWSAWSEDQSKQKHGGGAGRDVDDRRGRKSVRPSSAQAGRRQGSGVGALAGCGKVGISDKGAMGGGTGGDRANRPGGRGGVLAQRGARVVPVLCNESHACKRSVKGGGEKLQSASAGARSAGGGGGGGERGLEEAGGRGGERRAGKEGAAVRAHKPGVNRVSAGIESIGASRERQPISDSNHYYSSRTGQGKVASSGAGKGTARVNSSTQHKQQRAGLVSSIRQLSRHVSNPSATELEDVRKRLVHATHESEIKAPGPAPARTASADSYPQLLEFWRGIEQAFLRQPSGTPTTGGAPHH
ncbi:hypothetical protein L7F22_053702 [Adiantum nelumboides]|nr:hypothetical protein [Adiantum nelumboides]